MMKTCIVLMSLAAILAMGVFSFAEPRGPGHRGRRHERSAYGGGEFGHRGPGGVNRMFGRLLRNPDLGEKLGVTDQQFDTLREIGFASQKNRIVLEAKVAQAHLDVRQLLSQDQPVEADVMVAIEKAGQAAVSLFKSEVQHMLKVRTILGPEIWTEMKGLIGERARGHLDRRHRSRHHRSPGQGPLGRRRPGPPGDDDKRDN